MSALYISVVTLMYLLTTIDQARLQSWEDVLIWGGYAIANVGFIMKYSHG